MGMPRRSEAVRLLPALALGVSALVSGCAGDAPPDIVLITVDTLRPDHMGLYGYHRETTPNIDRWWSDSAIFRRAYAAEAKTPSSVMSILSGLSPQEHGVRLFYQLASPDTVLLPDLLPESYRTAAFVSNVVLTDEALGIADRFDHYDDLVDEKEPRRPVFERRAERTTDAVLHWLAQGRDEERPLFLWVHYIDPHGPYLPPDRWLDRFSHGEEKHIDVTRLQAYQRFEGVTDQWEYVDRYDEEIAYLDSEVGRLLTGASERLDLDRSLLVFTSDHGESMVEHEKWFIHGYHVYEEQVRVPLMIRSPRVRPGPREDLAAGIDLVPTILRSVGVEAPQSLTGVDLTTVEGLGERTVYTEATTRTRHWRAAIRADAKWVAQTRRGRRRIVERRYYDLARDPLELDPQPWPGDGEPLRALRERLSEDPAAGGQPFNAVMGRQIDEPKVSHRTSPEIDERLRSLGYLD
jgi:arylsulfatase A-like enzyme